MKKSHIDIIVNSDGMIIATAIVGPAYKISPLPGHSKHRVEIADNLIDKKSASEIHHTISNLLYFEDGVAKLKSHSK